MKTQLLGDPPGLDEVSVRSSESGMTLLELTFALSILSVVMIASGSSVVTSIRDRRESSDNYAAINAARDLISEIQSVANVDTDLSAQVGIGSIFARYHNSTQTLPNLANGSITVTCFANEPSVPNDLGGPQDLNFDADDSDNLSSIGASSDLKVVPMVVTVSYGETTPLRTLTLRRLIARTQE